MSLLILGYCACDNEVREEIPQGKRKSVEDAPPSMARWE